MENGLKPDHRARLGAGEVPRSSTGCAGSHAAMKRRSHSDNDLPVTAPRIFQPRRASDHIRSGPFEPVRPDLIHGQNSSFRIVDKDSVRDAIEEETKLCF